VKRLTLIPVAVVGGWLALLIAAGAVDSANPTIERGPTPTRQVCIQDAAANSVVVDCGDPTAVYIVLGVVERVTRGFNPKTTCSAWTRATGAVWKEYSWAESDSAASGMGRVLCVTGVAR